MKRLVLASKSPGRKQVLEEAKINFEIVPSDYEEDMTLPLSPEELVKNLSLGKARDVASQINDAIVIGADTIGVFNGKVLGKPHTKERAIEMLSMLSGNSHSMLTGLTLIDIDSKKEISKVVETKVWFKNLSPKEIEDYIKTGESLEKAGAYAYQGLGKNLVDRVEGSETNILGMPIEDLRKILEEINFKI